MGILVSHCTDRSTVLQIIHRFLPDLLSSQESCFHVLLEMTAGPSGRAV